MTPVRTNALSCIAWLLSAACLVATLGPDAHAQNTSTGTRRPADPDEAALTTLVADAKNRKLPAAELSRLAKKGLGYLVEHRGPYHSAWVDLIIAARGQGLVNDDEWKTFAIASLGFQSDFRDRLVAGGLALIYPRMKGDGGSDDFQGNLLYAISEVRFGTLAVPVPSPLKASAGFGPYTSWHFPFWLKVDVPPGVYHVTMPVRIRQFQLNSLPNDPELSFDFDVDLGNVEVVDRGTSIVESLDDPALQTNILAKAKPALYILQDNDSRGTPALSFTLNMPETSSRKGTCPDALVSRPRVHLFFKNNTTRDVDLPPICISLSPGYRSLIVYSQELVPEGLEDLDHADVILAPDREAAAGIPGVHRIWTGTLTLPNVHINPRR